MRSRFLKMLVPFVIPAILLAMVTGLTISLVSSNEDVQARELKMELDRQLQWEDQLKRDNRRLRSLVEALWTSTRLDEKIAREEANLIRPGDIVFQFPLGK